MLEVLVTGAGGFIGGRLVGRLVQRDDSVSALLRGKEGYEMGARMVKGDLTIPDFELKDVPCEVVYHLAAVWPGEKNKKIQRRINYDGTVNLFSKIRDKAKFLVYVSGLGVFGDTKGKMIDEDTPLNPGTEYARIRLEAQEFLKENCSKCGISFSVAYLGDVYGNGGWFRSMMVERIMRNSFRILGDGKYYRSFIHVEDAVSALISIAEKNQKGQSFVLTDSNPVAFSEFVNFVCSRLGKDVPGTIPAFIARPSLGSDFVTLLTTSTRASNSKMLKMTSLSFPSYTDGVESVMAEMRP
ncbi:MAG: NAD(P)-dependent oxidoreductase [Thaumarchaeota archaeon]|nr:NAD(P)-dependent oxidoreductase [Nitrososphaerota archaeon]